MQAADGRDGEAGGGDRDSREQRAKKTGPKDSHARRHGKKGATTTGDHSVGV